MGIDIESKYIPTDFLDIEDDLDGFVWRVSKKDGVAEGDVAIVPLVDYDVASAGKSVVLIILGVVLSSLVYGVIEKSRIILKFGWAALFEYKVMFLTPSFLWVVSLGKRKGRYVFIGGSRFPCGKLILTERSSSEKNDPFVRKRTLILRESNASFDYIEIIVRQGRLLGAAWRQKRVDRIWLGIKTRPLDEVFVSS